MPASTYYADTVKYSALIFRFLVVLAAAVLSGCETAQPPSEAVPVPVEPVPVEPPKVSEPVVVEEVRVLKLESFPVQAFAYVTGYLPEAGAQLDGVEQLQAGRTITIGLTASRVVGLVPATGLVPFEKQVPLEILGLPAGVYQVVVNGVRSELVLDRDNGTAPGGMSAGDPGRGAGYVVPGTGY